MLRKFFIGFAAVIAAALSLNASIGQVTRFRQPFIALAMPLPNGFAYSSAASAALASAQPLTSADEFNFKFKITPAIAKRVSILSLESYRSEPLDSAAVHNVALVTEWRGQQGRARELMRDALAITRRDGVANFWLMLDDGRHNQVEPMLRQLDVGLRTSTTAAQRMLPTLEQSLASDEMVQPLARLLRSNPPWKMQFWNGVFRVPSSLNNAAKLRLLLADEGYRNEAQNDRYLLDALVKHGDLEQAYALARKLTERSAGRTALLYNGSFDEQRGYAPYDWETFFNSTLATDILPGPGLLRIMTYSDGSGRSARQLVRLPDQTYRLRVKARDWDDLDSNALYFRVTCAEAPAARANDVHLELTSPEWSATFRKARSDCVYNWLEIYTRAQPQRRDNVIELDKIELEPIGTDKS